MRRHGDLRDHEAGAQSGFTLVEVLLAAALMSLLALLVATTTIGSLRATARAERRVDDVARAQAAMLRVTADLRAAECVLSAGPSSITVLTRSEAGVDGTPETEPRQVSYVVPSLPTPGGRRLVRTSQKLQPLQFTTCTAWRAKTSAERAAALEGSPVSADLLVDVVHDPAGRAVFTMLSVADSQRQCPTGPTKSTLGATVPVASLSSVYQVEVWLSINSAAHLGAKPLTVPAAAVLATGAGDLVLSGAALAGAGIGQGCP